MADRLILAVDVGGTKTDVALFRAGDPVVAVRQERFASADYDGLEGVVAEFLGDETVSAAGIAAAGPVRCGQVHTTNLPWVIDASRLSQLLGGAPVTLLNDLEAAAAGVLTLPPRGLHVLKKGRTVDAHRALLAPGTGLGQSILWWDGTDYHPSASEGGHVGFAPRDGEQVELLRFLQGRFSEVSFEHVLSGPGLKNLFDFVSTVLKVPVAAAVQRDLQERDGAAVVGSAALAGECAASVRSLDLFSRILAARAADLSLSVLAVGGIYLAGGMVPKLLPAMDAAVFANGFERPGPFGKLLREVPVFAVVEEKVVLLGAARAAGRQVR